MGLSTSEVVRVKTELGYNALTSGYPQLYTNNDLFMFEQIIAPFLEDEGETTCTTAVEASATPTPAVLALDDATEFAAGNIIIVDVDSRQERVTVQNKSGNNVTVLLTKEHSGTYPVAVESGVTIVRSILSELANLSVTISSLRSRAGIKKVEDIEFFGGGATLASQGIDPLTQVIQLREQWRDELASVLGVSRLNGENSSGGSSISVY